jgi:sortase (surface protein transpeptidase)
MKVLRALALVTFAGGLSIMLLAAACSGGGDDDDEHQQFNNQTPTATATPTNTLTPSPTPSPTPTPFDGNVARMLIPQLGVDYPIEDIGITNNQMDTPKNATGAIGWYHTFPKPGFGKNSVYSAHVNYNGRNGPFANLAKATEDTQIVIQMADGPTYTYQVFSNIRYDVRDIPMGQLIDRPEKPANEEWITLITCSCAPGRVLDPDGDGYGECLDRDVITARRIS